MIDPNQSPLNRLCLELLRQAGQNPSPQHLSTAQMVIWILETQPKTAPFPSQKQVPIVLDQAWRMLGWAPEDAQGWFLSRDPGMTEEEMETSTLEELEGMSPEEAARLLAEFLLLNLLENAQGFNLM